MEDMCEDFCAVRNISADDASGFGLESIDHRACGFLEASTSHGSSSDVGLVGDDLCERLRSLCLRKGSNGDFPSASAAGGFSADPLSTDPFSSWANSGGAALADGSLLPCSSALEGNRKLGSSSPYLLGYAEMLHYNSFISNRKNLGLDISRHRCDSRNGFDLNHNPPVLDGCTDTQALNYAAHGRLPRGIGAFGIDNRSILKGKGSPRIKDSWEITRPRITASVLDIKSSVIHLAMHQEGCRFLQNELEKGNPQTADAIFNGVIDHLAELMENQFGNYLMQKLLGKCSNEQRMRVIIMLTKRPLKLPMISMNNYGTRAVQKLIEIVKPGREVLLIMTALRPGLFQLIIDSNGYHVIKKCLTHFEPEDNRFIFEVAIRYCVDIATQQHGCCILQDCLKSRGDHQAQLLYEVCDNGLLLAQDPYGNYVIQYILELKSPSANAKLISQFRGNYVLLSTQKCSSNVVEKCLQVFCENDQAEIVSELLSVPKFDDLLQHPYANYVIQTAYVKTKGHLNLTLAESIRPLHSKLKDSPFCKRIFSRVFSNK